MDVPQQADATQSLSHAATAELKNRRKSAAASQLRAEIADDKARARKDAMGMPPPATVRAYRDVYGRDPQGWPPV
jgi:hypothetical protein